VRRGVPPQSLLRSPLYRLGRVGPLLGLNGLGCAVHVVPPGKEGISLPSSSCVQDELFFVVSGEGEYRFGETTVPVRTGDIVAAPAGTQAHQLINTGSDDLRYLGFSTGGAVDVVDYPDSKKIAIAAGVRNADFKTATYVGLGRLAKTDYYDGEDD
jgi:uncharacterized cupin superfamily protein